MHQHKVVELRILRIIPQTLKNDLAQHNLTSKDSIELALNKPLWRLLAASGATHWWCMPNNDDVKL